MRSFSRIELLHYNTGDRTGYIPPMGEWSFPFLVAPSAEPVCHRIRLIGETDYFWRWRTEWGAPYAIAMSINDVLTKQDTYHETYALEFPCHGDNHPRNAYLKFYSHDLCPGKSCRLAIPAKASGFHCAGEAGLFLELYFAKEGRHPNDVFDAPDQLISIPFPEGTYDWTILEKEFVLPEETVCAILRIGVRKCTGALKTGSPILSFDGAENIVPPLAPTQNRLEQFNYLGENLSRRDWLECAVLIDGQERYRGEKYSCIVRRPEYTFNVGTLPPGRHVFTLKLLNDYESAIGFVVQGLELHELGNHDFELIGSPETVTQDEGFSALIRTTSPDVTILAEEQKYSFAEPGLHALRFPPLATPAKTIVLSSASGHRDSFQLQAIPAGDRPIYLGTGDAVYIPHDIDDAERYLEWYVANRIGNCICFRHSYRWGGSRSRNDAMWRKIIPLLNELGLHYTLMVDGRELPGMNSSPTEELMQGPCYIGRRSHEHDGSFCYWFNALWARQEVPEPYGDLLSRGVNPGGIQPHVRLKRNGAKTWWFFDPEKAQDCREAAEYFIENLKDAKAESTRHSGPSALFRYFFQAGYDCLLAEQMYGPDQVILAALRGASRAYGKADFGTHLAVQWNSKPLDCQEHADRYFLALATSYMNGATDINTEEGLWRMEYEYADYDRFSHNCVLHQEAHQRFRRWMEHHPRRGTIVTPNACLQGRYDGWRCFAKGNLWGNSGDQWQSGLPEESFEMLHLFYPRARLNSVYCISCDNTPKGWYTGTPYGYADLVPWEGEWNRYSAITMLGWHTYQEGDGEKMLDYVRKGGRLLLCRRHLSMALRRDAKPVYPQDKALDELLGDDWQNTLSGMGVSLRKVGKGLVRFFGSDDWPAADSLQPEYLQAMEEQTKEATALQSEKGWILSNPDVEFAAYDLPDDSRVFYLLNIRWWDRQASQVTLLKGGVSTTIDVPFGTIVTL